MREVSVDCAGIYDARQLHDEIAWQLEFPQWYGRNLDALYDCLTSLGEDTHLRLLRFDQLGSYRRGFAAVLKDACQANSRLRVTFPEETDPHPTGGTMKEYEIIATYLNGCAGEAYPQTSFEEAEMTCPEEYLRARHPREFDGFRREELSDTRTRFTFSNGAVTFIYEFNEL